MTEKEEFNNLTKTCGRIPTENNLSPHATMGIDWLPEVRCKELLIDYTIEMIDMHQSATAQAACRSQYRQTTVQGPVSEPWHERVAKTRANCFEPGSPLPIPAFGLLIPALCPATKVAALEG